MRSFFPYCRPYNRKSDVWALGCILYELCTLKKAFDGHSLPALVVKILRGKYPPISTRYTSNMRNLVDSMLKQNPSQRPSVDDILQMDYVRGHVQKYAQHCMELMKDEPEMDAMLDNLTPSKQPKRSGLKGQRPFAGTRATPGATPPAAVMKRAGALAGGAIGGDCAARLLLLHFQGEIVQPYSQRFVVRRECALF